MSSRMSSGMNSGKQAAAEDNSNSVLAPSDNKNKAVRVLCWDNSEIVLDIMLMLWIELIT